MTITNIISAIGNTNTVYPLVVRDVCIENPMKVLISRKENMKESKEIANESTREKLIDEYATSAIWLGGIPLTEKLCDKYIKKQGWSPDVNLKLFKAEDALKNTNKDSAKNIYQGIEYNINKFKNINAKDVQDAVADLVKVKNNKSAYEKILTKKFCAATIIPTIIMGFVLPRLNFALTRKLRNDKKRLEAKQNSNNNKQIATFTSLNKDTFSKVRLNKNNNNISFQGNFTSAIANLRTVDKMAISDGGLTVGRVSTSRNKEEGCVNAYRMIGGMILNFVTPAFIAKGLDKFANAAFKINVNLDPLILEDKNFIDAIKNNNIELPKSNSEKDLLEFLDNNPKSLFAKFAQKMNKVSYLKSGYRDPRKFVDIKDLSNFKNEFETYINAARKSNNITKFAKKAKFVKGFNILANVGISSFLLAVVLPKSQYLFNKKLTGSYLDPGLRK